MGDKRDRQGQRFCVYLAGCLISAILIGCCATGPGSAWGPGWNASPSRHLVLSEYLLISGDYEGARREAEAVLERFAGCADDRALLLLGMAEVHPDNPQSDPRRASDAFRRIIEECPNSPLVVDARTWLTVMDRVAKQAGAVTHLEATAAALEIKLAAETGKRVRLEERLQQMKAVDLMVD